MKRYNQDVREKADEYKNSTTTKRKQEIVKGIIQRVKAQEPPGRFLAQDKKTRLWNEIDDEGASAKIKCRLRRDDLSTLVETETETETTTPVQLATNIENPTKTDVITGEGSNNA